MVALKNVFLAVALCAMTSDATLLGSVAGVPALTMFIGGKLIALPQILALKLVIGVLGLNFAGIRYLREKVHIPASISGSVAGYKANSAVMDAPGRIVEAKTQVLSTLFRSLPKLPVASLPSASPSRFQRVIKIPTVPVPSVQWKSESVLVPKLAFRPPRSETTLTIEKEIGPSFAPAPAPRPPQAEIVDRPY